jgi:hypothetical protein
MTQKKDKKNKNLRQISSFVSKIKTPPSPSTPPDLEKWFSI